MTGATFPEGLYPILLEHDLLAGVNRHLDRIEREPRFGFLLGRLYHCPEHDIDYAVADTAVAAREILSEEASGACIIRAWSEAQAVFSGHSGLLLGWYHSHYRFGLMPTEADRDTISRYFDAPWQLSIIVVPDRARPLGAVFRALATEGGGDDDRPAAFYELSPAPHGGDIGRAHSAVTWANYQAQPPAPPVFGPAQEVLEPEAPAAEVAAAEVTEEEAPAEEVAAGEAAAKDVVAQEEAVGEVTEEPPKQAVEEPEIAEAEVTDAEEPEAPAPEAEDAVAEEAVDSAANAEDESPQEETAEAGVEAADAEAKIVAEEPITSAEPSGVRMPPPPPTEAPGDFPAPRKQPRPPDRPMPPGDRSVRGVPLVMPGEKADVNLLRPGSRRIPWRVVATGAGLLAVALFLLWPDAPTESTGRVGPDPSSAGGDAVVSPELRQFLEDVDALEIAGERYGERAADFDAGRIGCDLLTTGYVAADEAYVRVAAAYGDPEVRSNPRAAAAYEEAGAEIAEINSHFDGSGCPRP